MEQTAYNTFTGINEERKSVLDPMPAGASAAGQLVDLCNLIVTQEKFDKGKSGLYEKGDLKWKYKASSYTPWIRSLRVLKDPYEAAKSYEYGRTTYK